MPEAAQMMQKVHATGGGRVLPMLNEHKETHTHSALPAALVRLLIAATKCACTRTA